MSTSSQELKQKVLVEFMEVCLCSLFAESGWRSLIQTFQNSPTRMMDKSPHFASFLNQGLNYVMHRFARRFHLVPGPLRASLRSEGETKNMALTYFLNCAYQVSRESALCNISGGPRRKSCRNIFTIFVNC